jgi:hypothetical protein
MKRVMLEAIGGARVNASLKRFRQTGRLRIPSTDCKFASAADHVEKHCRQDRRSNRRCSSAVKPAELRPLDKHRSQSGSNVAEKAAEIGPNAASYAVFTTT